MALEVRNVYKAIAAKSLFQSSSIYPIQRLNIICIGLAWVQISILKGFVWLEKLLKYFCLIFWFNHCFIAECWWACNSKITYNLDNPTSNLTNLFFKIQISDQLWLWDGFSHLYRYLFYRMKISPPNFIFYLVFCHIHVRDWVMKKIEKNLCI